MQHAADFKKFTIRVNDRKYEFSDLENTRTADRALSYLLKIKQQEMQALREELAPKENSKGGKTSV
jgi:hypothetical protein